MNAYRQNSVFLSDEVHWYLKCKAKAAVQGTTASITVDQIADNLLRNLLTTDQPELVNLYSELASARLRAKDAYKDIEERSVKFLSNTNL